MTTSVDDVAAALLEAAGPMTAMKRQKMVYYVQAWHLARHETPAFDEAVEAWRDGPVIRRLFDQHRNQRVVREWVTGRAEALGSTVREVVADVVDRYGGLSAEQLSQISHREAPWRRARRGTPDAARSDAVIARRDIVEFYRVQAGHRSTAVGDAVASARLEGADPDEKTLGLMERVAAGELSADEAVRRALQDGG